MYPFKLIDFLFLRELFQISLAVFYVSAGNFFSSQVIQNRLLVSSVTAAKHSCLVRDVDWMECILRCSKDASCVSYNFDLTRGTCEFNAFGLLDGDCGAKRLLYGKGVVFQQMREDKNQSQCMASVTCAPDHNQVGQESCQVSPPRSSCNDIIKHGESRGDGEYTIKPDGSSELRVYCDMTTAGGGWTLIKKSTISKIPVIVSMTLTAKVNSISNPTDLSVLITPTGLQNIRNLLGFKQMRWVCYKQSVKRKVHIMTNDDAYGENVIRYFTTSTTPAAACKSFTRLPDDTSYLSQNCLKWGTTDGYDDSLNQWGRKDRTGEQRIHSYVMIWVHFSQNYIFSMLPGQYMCDDTDESQGALTINDWWALYVR